MANPTDAPKPDAPKRGVELRESYKDLMAAGARTPGVADLIQVYSAFARHAPVTAVTVTTRYSTGGNG